MIDLDLFFQYLMGRCHGNQFCEKNGKLLSLVVLTFQNGMGYRYLDVRINSINDASILCKNFMNFGPVTPELTESSFLNVWYNTAKKWRTWSNISGYTGPIFTIFSLHKSAIGADDVSVPHFPIC